MVYIRMLIENLNLDFLYIKKIDDFLAEFVRPFYPADLLYLFFFNGRYSCTDSASSIGFHL